MLTTRHIETRKAWAQAYMNTNRDKTIFTDETALDIFRSKVSRWHKDGNRPIRRLPKVRQKIMAWAESH